MTNFRDVKREIKKGKAVKSDKIVLMKRDI